MRVSVNLADEEIAFIDRYATDHAVGSRSAVVQRALLLLQTNELGDDYAGAWEEWEAAGGDAWESVAADGLPEAS